MCLELLRLFAVLYLCGVLVCYCDCVTLQVVSIVIGVGGSLICSSSLIVLCLGFALLARLVCHLGVLLFCLWV